jgi:hypothetical protein
LILLLLDLLGKYLEVLVFPQQKLHRPHLHLLQLHHLLHQFHLDYLVVVILAVYFLTQQDKKVNQVHLHLHLILLENPKME